MDPWQYDKLAHRIGEIGTAFIRRFPAEFAHDLTMKLLERGVMRLLPQPLYHPEILGLGTQLPAIGELLHPIGLAAGLDKNCQAPTAFAGMGLAFVEVGTVTPRAQTGNAKPRLFRQCSQGGLVNRMGFNNLGAKEIAGRVANFKKQKGTPPLGVNLGKNKDTPIERALDDYVALIAVFAPLADYLVVNISSPNTSDLRSLAEEGFVRQLADASHNHLGKIWIKLDPDMGKAAMQKVINAIAASGFAGVILTNTHKVNYPTQGGQSGHPLMALSTACLEWAYEVHRGELAMIGSGGILSGVDIYQKVIRGAAAVQIYTALIYRGPWAALALMRELAEELKLHGFRCLKDAIGSYYR